MFTVPQPGAGRNERYAGDERLCRDCFWRLWPGVVGGDHYPRLSGHGHWSDDRNSALFQPDDRCVLWAAGDALPDGVSSTCRAGTEFPHRNGGSRAVRHLPGCAGRGRAGHR